MLRERSRAVISDKQSLMTDHVSPKSPTEKSSKPSSSFFTSSRLFTSFPAKGFSDSDSVMSPTSILDTKPFSCISNPFWSDRYQRSPEPHCVNTNRPYDNCDSKGIGLGIVDALSDNKFSKPDCKMVLFGSQLKTTTISPIASPKSPNSQSTSFSSALSPCLAHKTPFGSVNSGPDASSSPRIFTGCLSSSDFEPSEDYTCVIYHGAKPKMTHIFDDCVVEESCGVGFSSYKKEDCMFVEGSGCDYPSHGFLSFCYNCKRSLGQGDDIYMYRGEKAFCSRECRFEEMLFDEKMEQHTSDSFHGHCDEIFDAVTTFS
eukprot:TRINITY_DN3935_c0_g1_i1.p1 TRINITY_DN3935_c0_g1~~TRINITY_DN3935_c0_g1_i1.p1  ORF type:complete len:316 (+),score=25.87 TRINITY_DN3935_c0_g1_i1:287-1234(+)